MTRLLTALLLCLVAAPHVFAQSNAANAALDGYVTDSQGAALPGASVTVTSVLTNQSSDATTDDAGYYRFQVLPLGTYTVRVSLPGFTTSQRTGLELRAGQLSRVSVTLSPGVIEEAVQVTGRVNVVTEAGSSAVGAVLDEQAVRTLPLPSRNPFNFNIFAGNAKGLPSPNLGTILTYFGGQYAASYNHDGLDNSARQTITVRITIAPADSVKEVQVLSSNYSAEFGRSRGGVINILTQSGTNALHGSATYMTRPDGAAARPALSATKPSFDWNMAAASIGGPIRKDRLFFFANHEWFHPFTPNSVAIGPDVAARLGLDAAALAAGGIAQNFHTANGRVDYQIGNGTLGFVRVNRFHGNTTGSSGGLEPRYRQLETPDVQWAVTGQLARTFRNSMNEFRAGFFNRQLDSLRLAQPPGTEPWDVSLAGQATLGYNPLSDNATTTRAFQFADVFSSTRGRYTWKAGFDYLHYLTDLTLSQGQQYTFSGLPAVAGVRGAITPLDQYLFTRAGTIDPASGSPFTYSLLRQDIGTRSGSSPFHAIAGFFTVDTRLSPHVSLTLGARYDVQVNPTLDASSPFPESRSVNTDTNNLAPRLGVVWSPGDSGATVVRGGYGIYYDLLNQQQVLTAKLSNGQNLLSYSIPGSAPGAPAYGQLFTSRPSGITVQPSIFAFDPDLRTVYAHQATAQVDQRLTDTITVGVGYQFYGGRDITTRRDVNLGTPVGVLADGRPVYAGAAGRPDPRFGSIYLIESNGISNYNGIDLWVRKRFSRGVSFGSTYSWSHALADSIGSDFSLAQDPSNLHGDYGNSDFDIRHYWTAYGVFELGDLVPGSALLRGTSLSLTNYFNGGFPFNGLAGPDLNGDTALNDRVLFRGYNAFRMPAIHELDVRIARSVHVSRGLSLQVTAESQNLLNRLNPSSVVNVESRPDFGRPVAARNPRTFQFGVRAVF